MYFLFNECSTYPLATSVNDADQLFRKFIKTYRKAEQAYTFRGIQFAENFHQSPITNAISFIEYITQTRDSLLKNTLLALYKKPYKDDVEEEVYETYLSATYKLEEQAPEYPEEALEALPLAKITNSPTISLHSDDYWTTTKIKFWAIEGEHAEEEWFAYNLCLVEDVSSDDLKEWLKKYRYQRLSEQDPQTVIHYLNYTKYAVEWEETFITELFEWKTNDLVLFDRILLLMEDVEEHPFTGGLGQTENLQHGNTECWKRITREHRLVYTLINDVVTFISCKGHP